MPDGEKIDELSFLFAPWILTSSTLIPGSYLMHGFMGGWGEYFNFEKLTHLGV